MRRALVGGAGGGGSADEGVVMSASPSESLLAVLPALGDLSTQALSFAPPLASPSGSYTPCDPGHRGGPRPVAAALAATQAALFL